MLPRLLLAGWLAAGSILALAAPAWGAGWLPPSVIGQSATTDDSVPVVASAPDGSAAVAWLSALPDGKNAVRVALRGASGPFGADQTLPEGGSTAALRDVHVAINARGDAAVAWIDPIGVGWVAVRPAGAAFGAPIAIPSETYSATELTLGIDATGTALVATTETRYVLDGSCGSPFHEFVFLRFAGYPVSTTGAVGPRQTIFAPNVTCFTGYESLASPRIAVNPRGDVIAAVYGSTSGSGIRVISRSLPGGMFGNVTYLSGAYQASVAIAPNGHYIAGLSSSAQTAGSVAGIAGGPPGALQALSAAPPNVTGAEAGIDAGGAGTVAWQATPGGDVRRVYARSVSAAGTPGPVLPELSAAITDSVAPYLDPRIAVGGPGAAFVVWRGIDGPSGHYEIDASTSPPAGGFAVPFRISGDPGQDATQGDVAADAAGGAIAVFRKFDGTANRIHVAAFDVAPPVLGVVDVPATTTRGALAGFAATATDDWGPVTLHWDFGDGSGADGSSPSHAFAAVGTPTITVTATDGAGNQATATRQLAVAAPPVPTVSAVRMAPSRFRVSKSATAIVAKRAPRGTKIRFAIAAAATATIAFQRPAAGRSSKGRCLKPTRRLRKARRCTRYLAEGRLTRKDLAAGPVAVAFSGRVGRKALRRGRHRVVVTATTLAGVAAKGKPARFTIVR